MAERTIAAGQLHRMRPDAASTRRLLHLAGQAGEAAWSSIVGDKLTARQFDLLRAMKHAGPCTQRKLAETTGIDRSTVSDMVGRLSRRGLVTAVATGEDKRMQMVTLSGTGKRLLRSAEPLAHAVDARLERTFREDEMDALHRGLMRIIEETGR